MPKIEDLKFEQVVAERDIAVGLLRELVEQIDPMGRGKCPACGAEVTPSPGGELYLTHRPTCAWSGGNAFLNVPRDEERDP